MFSPTIDAKNKLTFGEYCENLLNEYDYYGTRLSRIPIQIEREIKTNLYNLQQVKNRKIENEKNIQLFNANKSCKAVSFQDNNWHSGKIIQNLNNKKILVLFEGNDDLLKNLEATENKCKEKKLIYFFKFFSIFFFFIFFFKLTGYNFDILKMRLNELKDIYLNEKREVPFFKGEEIVDISNIILEEEKIEKKKDDKKEKEKDEKSKYKKRSRSNSRNSSRSHGNRKKRRKSSSSSKHRSKKHRYRSSSSESSKRKKDRRSGKHRHSRSRSRSRSRSTNIRNSRVDKDLSKKDNDKE